jgi:AraC family transcriptional regulator
MSSTLQLAQLGEIQAAGIRELAFSVISLLQTATREVERDRDVAKTFIARASSLLQVEVDRRAIPDWQVTSGGLAPWQIHRVKAFVESRLSDSIHVDDLSELARLSATHFSRAFRRSFGEAPHAYIVSRRLARARHLMLTSDIGLGELAFACGFTDQAHLCKLFRQATGKTPAVWRRERREAIQMN